MTYSEIFRYRLVNQQIGRVKSIRAQGLVKWQVIMQAQNFAMAMWAIGLRLPHLSRELIEQAFNDGSILRTHIMRPVWHFVTPEDICWILTLMAPRVHMNNSFSYRKFELDAAVLNRSKDIIVRALEGGKYLTRLELMILMYKAGIETNRYRFAYIMMHAELEKIVCSGPQKEKQLTYALFDERVPPAATLTREESLSELAARYFASHGPATLYDFAWWSGLAIKDAKTGVNALGPDFCRETIDGYEYIFIPTDLSDFDEQKACFLMPDYDEYGIAYKNRDFMFHPEYNPKKLPFYGHAVVVDGFIAGTWKALENKNQLDVKTTIHCPLSERQIEAVSKAVNDYKGFAKPDDLNCERSFLGSMMLRYN